MSEIWFSLYSKWIFKPEISSLFSPQHIFILKFARMNPDLPPALYFFLLYFQFNDKRFNFNTGHLRVSEYPHYHYDVGGTFSFAPWHGLRFVKRSPSCEHWNDGLCPQKEEKKHRRLLCRERTAAKETRQKEIREAAAWHWSNLVFQEQENDHSDCNCREASPLSLLLSVICPFLIRPRLIQNYSHHYKSTCDTNKQT